MAGILYIVSTPIGNLEDISFRALRILKEVAIVAAEDTRHTKTLLTHYGINTPLTSYHDFNKEEKAPVLLERLKEGRSVALVSDAGTPTISDPGYFLITQVLAAGLRVVPVPGASALLAALAASGLPTDAFVFEGFLPRKAGPRRRLLESLREERRTVVVFESPHRLRSSLEVIREVLGARRIVLARELTKLHEEVLRGTAEELLKELDTRTLKGELTLVLEGKRERKGRPANEGRTR
jgi:16S rRNA (cytidine1402-2'-O)-methyltransferase